ncbi:MAG: transposase [Richelia sp. RM2_1_2]|nr:transposase [Richelia sp. RM2_1_2]
MSKSQKIKNTLAATKLRRQNQKCKVFELKIDESKLSTEKRKKLNDCFIQAKWIYNNLISQNDEVSFHSSQKEIAVKVFNPETQECDKTEIRKLTIGSQVKQAICDRFVQNIVNLSKAKAKGRKIGRLKFKKDVFSVPLKQFGTTYKILDNQTISIQCVGKLRARGLGQIKNAEIANAHLTKDATGFYVQVTCFEEKTKAETSGAIGIDFGIKDSIALSDGRKFSWNFEIPAKLKRKQKKLSRKKRGSKNYVKLSKKIRKNYKQHCNKKDDAANKFVSSLKGYSKVVMQDEAIHGWHAGLFGKQVQQSILGRIKSRINQLETSVVIDRWLPTTKISPITGKKIKIGLDERMFIDGNFTEDRDIKSAKTILYFGLYNPNLTAKELSGLPPEEITAVFKQFYCFESKLLPLNEEASPFKAG